MIGTGARPSKRASGWSKGGRAAGGATPRRPRAQGWKFRPKLVYCRALGSDVRVHFLFWGAADPGGDSGDMHWASRIAVGLAVAVVLVYGWRWLGPGRWGKSPESLLRQALEADDSVERQKAAAALGDHPEASADLLVQLLRQSDDPMVRAVAVRVLGDRGAYDHMDTVIAALEDESLTVRASAAQGLSQLLQRKIRFPADGTEAQRAVALAQVKATWGKLRNSPALECLKQGKPLAWFYDRNTKELFEGPADSPGPIETPSGPYEGMPAGVRAHLFVCGSREDEQPFIGYVSIPETALQKGPAADPAEGPESEGEVALLIQRPGDRNWVHQDSPGGERILQAVIQQCPAGKYPRPVLPGD